MRSLVSITAGVAMFASHVHAAAVFHYRIAGDQPGAWPRILSATGLVSGGSGVGVTAITGAAAQTNAEQWQKLAASGETVIVEGETPAAQAFGFVPDYARRAVPTRNIIDAHNPKLSMVWEQAIPIPYFQMPPEAIVFSRERWDGAPVMAGVKHGAGAVLWLAVSPGEKGHERLPYVWQALARLGAQPALQSRDLWAFFDASYRSRVDPDYFAERWRRSGIAALHVAAWHFFEPDEQRDAYLRKLIEACHKRAILIYAWLEFPHVSERFWNDHPDWREKTAIGQDAHLDWRRLMNLRRADCAEAVAAETQRLFDRFDWDGINLAELYFESLEGIANPARFTPMNADVRREFTGAHGFDPLQLFDSGAKAGDAAAQRLFLDWRAGLVHRLQEEWIGRMEKIRARKPHLGLVLTHVDDRYDTRMRDLIGADAARLLPKLARQDFTFLIEDPATVWHLGPERYPEIARRYQPLTDRHDKLAIDINIVERYQDVYPTKQQTGTELFQLVNLASRAFARVALYFENSILTPDVPLLAASSAVPDRLEFDGRKLTIESRRAAGVPAAAPVQVNGRPWPFWNGTTAWLPAGAHTVEPSPAKCPIHLVDFNGRLLALESLARGFEFSYTSEARAWAVFDSVPARVEVDDEPVTPAALLALPRGQHVVRVTASPRALKAD